jgi:hypothetical protein
MNHIFNEAIESKKAPISDNPDELITSQWVGEE